MDDFNEPDESRNFLVGKQLTHNVTEQIFSISLLVSEASNQLQFDAAFGVA